MTDGTLQPLDQKFPIVDAQGLPTEYFIRWTQQKQIDIRDSITGLDGKANLDGGNTFTGPQFINGGVHIVTDTDTFTIDKLSIKPLVAAGYPVLFFTDETGVTARAAIYGPSDTDLQVYFDGPAFRFGPVSEAEVWFNIADAGCDFQLTPTVGATHHVYHEGNLSFGSGLTYNAGTGELTASGGGGGSGWTLISDQVLAVNAASLTFSAIPGTYKDLRIEYEARQTAAAPADDVFHCQFNADAAANYQSYDENRFGNANNAAATMIRCGTVAGSGTTAGVYAFGVIDVFAYSDATRFKNLQSRGFFPVGAFEDRDHGIWRSNAAITAVKLLFSGAQVFAAGSRFRLYGGM
jgi:hypothetical protein